MPKRTPKIKYYIMCDDIRREIGNKTSLMGVYQDIMILPSLPTKRWKLCFRMNFENVRSKHTTIKVRLLDPEEKELALIGPSDLPQPPVEMKKKKYFKLIMDIKFENINLKTEGDHTLQCVLGDEDTPLEIKFKVLFAPKK